MVHLTSMKMCSIITAIEAVGKIARAKGIVVTTMVAVVGSSLLGFIIY